MMGIYEGEHGAGQYRSYVDPMVRRDRVRTSSRRSRARLKTRCVGANVPEPKRLSRKVAPSGFDEVVPGIWLEMIELAGTTHQLRMNEGG